MNKNVIIGIVFVLAIGSSFFGGMKYQEIKGSQSPASGFRNRGGFTAQSGRGNQGANQGTARPVRGEIIAQDDKSITVKMQDNSTKIVLFSTSTTINKATESSTADLKTGEQVFVVGTDNQDGSITAQNIQLGSGILPTGSNTPSK